MTHKSSSRAANRSWGTCSGHSAAANEKITVRTWLLQAGSNRYFTHNTYSQAVQLLPTCSHPESGHPRVNLTLTGLQKDLSIAVTAMSFRRPSHADACGDRMYRKPYCSEQALAHCAISISSRSSTNVHRKYHLDHHGTSNTRRLRPALRHPRAIDNKAHGKDQHRGASGPRPTRVPLTSASS